MPDHAPEATRLNPGEKWRPDATFDLTLKLGWARLKDEDTRVVQAAKSWREPGTFNNENMRAGGAQAGGAERLVYLAVWHEGTPAAGYLRYDGKYDRKPVNQAYYLPEWRANVARFAHGFDILPGFESFRQLSASQKVTAYRVGQTLAGAAWARLGLWTTYDPRLSDDWKSPAVFDFVEKAVTAVCDERCASESGARRLALSIAYSEFAAKLEAGHIHGTNREVNPWTPGTLLTIVPTPDEETTIETAIFGLVASFNGARDYYDAHVAHQVVEHDHD